MKNLFEAMEVHETLNPKIWNLNTNNLLPEVEDQINKVIDSFRGYTHVPIDVVDIQIVGSNASFNYTENSDLDVHIIADYASISEDVNILRLLYDSMKSNFNKNFDISVHGVEIELYIQDINSGIISNGIYSMLNHEWIKFPEPIEVKVFDTSEEVKKLEHEINDILIDKNLDDIQEMINRLYLIRHNSIAAEGEYSKGNQIFKDIRSKGLLDLLKKELNAAISKELSLESLSNGQIVNRLF